MINDKKYELEKSPLFRLRNKAKLEKYLSLPTSFFRQRNNEFYTYYTFNIVKKNKVRTIHEPNDDLKKAQKKLNKLLGRIITPDWLKSGIKGSSYITNAIRHQNSKYILTADIKSFYPSCHIKHLKDTFVNLFKMEEDVAWTIAKLTTVNGSIPHGAPSSQLLAYWANKDLFCRIANISDEKDCTFSLYVDDMTFSSTKPICNNLLYNVKEILKEKGLIIKDKKTRYYNSNSFKTVTGVVITPNNNIVVPNNLRYKIIKGYESFKSKNNDEEKIKLGISLLGSINSARQIESKIFPEIKRQIELHLKNSFKNGSSTNKNV